MNIDWTSFEQFIAIQSDAQTVYDYWTKPELLTKWFLSDAIFKNESGKILGMGDSAQSGCFYEFDWHVWQNCTESGKVIKANGKDEFSFSFAGDCIVKIKIEVIGNHVKLTLKQSNIPVDDESKVQKRLGCHAGWLFYLVNLKSVLEGGLDLRNRQDQFLGAING